MDCSSCFYPNDDEAQFCIRCATPLGVPVTRLPRVPAPAPALSMSGSAGLEEVEFQNGRLLCDKYRLLRRLGSGGFGSVYEAEQVPLGLRVAVKLLNRAALLDARVRERFLDEARMVAQLRNPHVVSLHDYDVTPAGTPYLVMELLHGQDVGMLLCRSVLSPERALRIAVQVCAALAEAHNAGIVHRDVKPENVVLVTRGSETDFVKMVDFGVAKFCSGAGTRASGILGTPAYIAPEMLANEPIDGRSDLYALGIMLWEMIVGRLPFPGDNQAVMMTSHLHAARRWPRELDRKLTLPDELEALLAQVVARDPEQRPRTAYALRARLLELIPSAPAAALNVPPPQGGPAWDAPQPP